MQVYDAVLKVLGCVTASPLELDPSGSVQLDVTGPTGSPWFLVFGFLPGATPTPFGFDVDIAGAGLYAAGVHGATPFVINQPLGGSPSLSGLDVHLQLVTDDNAGTSGQWLKSLVEVVSIL